MNPDCIFCKIIAGEIPGTIVYQDEQLVAFKDINPHAPVHLLITPRKHIHSVNEAGEEDEQLLGHLFTAARKIAAQLPVTDYRLVVNTGPGAGQTVFHVHMHLIAGKPLQDRLG